MFWPGIISADNFEDTQVNYEAEIATEPLSAPRSCRT
jgi:hypothetical protein